MAKQKPGPAAPPPAAARAMVKHTAPPFRMKVLADGKPWRFEAGHLFVADVQSEMQCSLMNVYNDLLASMGVDMADLAAADEKAIPETNQRPPRMDLIYELAYHLTGVQRLDDEEAGRPVPSFRRFLVLLGVASAEKQAELITLVMGLVSEAMAGGTVSIEGDSGNAEEPAPETAPAETATSPQAG